MRILAIETSCDETALALLECSGSIESPVIKAISQALYSQVKEHAPFGGVFPALAKREHVKNIVPLFLECLEKGQMLKKGSTELSEEKLATIKTMLDHERGLFEQFEEHIVPLERPMIDAIAVTRGPGLEPALWVGVNFAKALSYLWDMPIVPTNHMEGHIASVLVNEGASEVSYPALALLASGGHTELVLIDKPLSYRRIGQTRDDAVGEAFDKVARLLGLPYPGGPQISKLAAGVRAKELPPSDIKFPRPMVNSDDYDFSYAGLKTAVLYKIQELGELTDELKERIAYEFEEAATDVLISKTKKALEAHGAQVLIVGGGVIANVYLRERLTNLAAEAGVILMLPTRELSTDNAIMIGAAAYLHLASGESYQPYSPTGKALEADGTLRL
jgi:N6-L-threonylcarbamoyladenine synthase